MDKKVDLIKKVWDKKSYENTIDSTFEELGVKEINVEIEEQVSIEEFFKLYDQLFYEIPQKGDIDSHEYLIKTSSEYINFQEDLVLIKALREEISQVKKELLDEQMKNIKLEVNGQ